MKLQDFYRRVGPFLLGEQSHPDAVLALYGSEPPQPDAERLAIYGRFCRNHRHEVLDGIFVALRALVVARCGEERWDQLVGAYFRAHPMHHFELNRNGAAFPSFLDRLQSEPIEAVLGERPLPTCAAELADFEWWEWQTLSALDDPADLPIDHGALRLHSTVELRPYRYNWLAWFDRNEEAAPQPVEPALTDTLVLFWRDRDLAARRDTASPVELQLIKAVYEGLPIDAELARIIGCSLSTLAELAWDHYRAGILIGDPKLLPHEDSDYSA